MCNSGGLPQLDHVVQALDALASLRAQHREFLAAFVSEPTVFESQPAIVQPQPTALQPQRQPGPALTQLPLLALSGSFGKPGRTDGGRQPERGPVQQLQRSGRPAGQREFSSRQHGGKRRQQ